MYYLIKKRSFTRRRNLFFQIFFLNLIFKIWFVKNAKPLRNILSYSSIIDWQTRWLEERKSGNKNDRRLRKLGFLHRPCWRLIKGLLLAKIKPLKTWAWKFWTFQIIRIKDIAYTWEGGGGVLISNKSL